MAKNKITFGKMNSYGPGNGGSIEIIKNGESVGEILRLDESVWSGTSRRYVTDGYSVDIFDRVLTRTFTVTKHTNARTALADAKDFARKALEG